MSLRILACSAAVTALLLVTGVVPLRAQSLADLAREEEARRKEIKQPSKVYTNRDLGQVPPATAQAASPPADANKTAAKDEKAAVGAKGAAADPPKDIPRDQAYWLGRMKGLVSQLDQDDTFGAALQSRISALTADFSARDDPAQRAIISRDRQKAVDELDRLKTRIVNGKKAIADLQEEARRASVPPGWLR